MIKKENTYALDPLPIRDIIIQKEKERIRRKKIAPVNRLFDLGNMEIFEDQNILMASSGIRRLGQQDCKDFFLGR